MSSPLEPSTMLKAQSLGRRFGPRWVLKDIDVSVKKGRTVMLTGPNGSGKTTLLRCLATALPIHHGSLELLQQSAWESRQMLRRQISLVSHATRLYEDLSASENLRTWSHLGEYAVDEASLLMRVGLPTNRRDPVSGFSAGMRRRLALAIGLMKQPDILFLDEPFAALDPQGRDLLIEIMRDIRSSGTTMIVATHHPEITQAISDDALHLEHGEVVE